MRNAIASILMVLPLSLAVGQQMKEKPVKEGYQAKSRVEQTTRKEHRGMNREDRRVNRNFTRHERNWRPERHDRNFYVTRYGDKRLKEINGGWYFYENGCWIAAVGYDPAFGEYSEYEICPGDQFYVDLDID